MSSLIVAIPNDEALAAEIGKKGSQNGVTYYNRKVDDGAIVVIVPSDVAAKFYAIGEIMSIADIVVISTAKVDSLFGESVIAASMLGKKTIFTTENDVSGILKAVSPTGHEFVDRKDVLNKIAGLRSDSSRDSEALRIDVDKSFPVKGVGTVILGIVRSGVVRVHDALKSSGGKELSVRSIQVHDADHQEAKTGDRVGLAVKGVDHTDIEKGDILSKEKKPYATSITAELRKSPLSKDEAENMNCTLVTGFSVVNCKITKDGDKFSLKLERPTALWKSDSFILIRDKAPRVFASGVVSEVA